MATLEQVMQEQRAIRQEMAMLSERIMLNQTRIDQLQMQQSAPAMAPPPLQRNSPPPLQMNFQEPVKAPRKEAWMSSTQPMMTTQAQTPYVTRELLKNAISSVCQQTPKSDTWYEEKSSKTSTSAVDRCQKMLKEAFTRYFSDKGKFSQSPITALQTLLRNLDANHSGKVDIVEFKTLCKKLQFSANDSTMEALFHRYDLDRSGYIEANELGKLLLDPEGDVSSTAKTCLARMREVLCYRMGGFATMEALGRQFRIIDRDRSGSLSREEFNIMLDTFFTYYGIKWTRQEKESLTAFFDRDGSGQINYDEYIRAVRGDMNDFRAQWVQKAFQILDRDGSGEITMDELMSCYDVSKNPAVMSRKTSPQEAQRMFMANYDTDGSGTVHFDEFLEGYQWISASIDNDDYFELMMRNAWHISGGEGWAANTANRRVLVEYMDGSQTVEEIKDDLGLDFSNHNAIVARLKSQGIRNIAQVKLYS